MSAGAPVVWPSGSAFCSFPSQKSDEIEVHEETDGLEVKSRADPERRDFVQWDAAAAPTKGIAREKRLRRTSSVLLNYAYSWENEKASARDRLNWWDDDDPGIIVICNHRNRIAINLQASITTTRIKEGSMSSKYTQIPMSEEKRQMASRDAAEWFFEEIAFRYMVFRIFSC